MLTIAKTVAPGSFGFNTEHVVRTLVFVKKTNIDHAISVRNPMERRPFQSEAETEGCGALDSAGLGQGRHFLKSLGAEPLNP